MVLLLLTVCFAFGTTRVSLVEVLLTTYKLALCYNSDHENQYLLGGDAVTISDADTRRGRWALLLRAESSACFVLSRYSPGSDLRRSFTGDLVPASPAYTTLDFLLTDLASTDPDWVAASSESLDCCSPPSLRPVSCMRERDECSLRVSPTVDLLRLRCLVPSGLRYRSILSLTRYGVQALQCRAGLGR